MRRPPARFRGGPAVVRRFRSSRLRGLGVWVELFSFSLVVASFSAGASLFVVGIGVVIVGLTIEGCRLVARLERSRASLADPRPLRPHAYRPYGNGVRDLLLAEFVDMSRWRDVVYVGVAFPLTILEFVVTVVLWGISIGLLSVPLWYATSSLPPDAGWLTTSSLAVAVAAGLAGLVLAPVAASASQGLMALHRGVVAGLLCDSEQRQLERRVETLEGSRKAVIDVEASDLRRIERDRSQRSARIIGGGPVDRCPRAVRAAHQVANGCRLPFPDDSAHDDGLVSLARLRLFRGLRLSRSMSRAA